MAWRKTKLKDLGWLRSAGVNKLSETNQKEVRLLNYMDVYRNQKITNEIDLQIVTAKKTEIKNANLKIGDILFTPSSEKPTDIGHAGIIIEEMPNTVYSYHLVRFRPDDPYKFNPHFLAYALNSFSCEKHFITRATGTTRYTLSKSDFKSLEFEYPENSAEQTGIATLLSKVDEAICATENSIQTAEKLTKALIQNLLTGKLKPDGTWRTNEELHETKIGFLPKTWEVKTVKEISTQVTDGEHSTPDRTDSGYFLLSARNIKNGYLDLSNVDYVNDKELKRIQKRCNPKFGDILISCSGTIGNVCMVPEGLNAGMVRSAALVKLKRDEIEPEFAELVFQSFTLQNQMKVSVSSSVQGNIFQGAIKKLKLPYPVSKEERDMITDKIRVFLRVIVEKKTKTQMLQRLKKSLMQNLLTGKMRLPAQFIAQFEEAVKKVNETVTVQ